MSSSQEKLLTNGQRCTEGISQDLQSPTIASHFKHIFDGHINAVTLRATRSIGLLQKLDTYLPQFSLTTVTKSFGKLLVRYIIIPFTRPEYIQNKASLVIHGDHPYIERKPRKRRGKQDLVNFIKEILSTKFQTKNKDICDKLLLFYLR